MVFTFTEANSFMPLLIRKALLTSHNKSGLSHWRFIVCVCVAWLSQL